MAKKEPCFKKGEHPNSKAAIQPHQFQPGQTGNAGGRPKKFPITDLLREELDLPLPEEVRTRLIASGVNKTIVPLGITWGRALVRMELMRGLTKTLAVRLIAELTEGKPKQRIELTGDDGGAVAVDLETVHDRLVEKLLSRTAEAGGDNSTDFH
jgi:hypothetical protein